MDIVGHRAQHDQRRQANNPNIMRRRQGFSLLKAPPPKRAGQSASSHPRRWQSQLVHRTGMLGHCNITQPSLSDTSDTPASVHCPWPLNPHNSRPHRRTKAAVVSSLEAYHTHALRNSPHCRVPGSHLVTLNKLKRTRSGVARPVNPQQRKCLGTGRHSR